MPSARCCNTPGSVTVAPSLPVTVPPSSAVWRSAAVGLATPASVSANCASASECDTLPQPIGFVGGLIEVVVTTMAPEASVDVVESVAGVAVRSAVANASALSLDPASVANGAARRPATRNCPADTVVVLVAAGCPSAAVPVVVVVAAVVLVVGVVPATIPVVGALPAVI